MCGCFRYVKMFVHIPNYVLKFRFLPVGFQHLVKVQLCSCEPEAVTLFRLNMWPSTPKNPTLVFEIEFLVWLESLMLEAFVNADSFCRAVELKVG